MANTIGKLRNRFALNVFWYWINERHQIYLNRKAGKPWPWTTDPILQEYKFTNVFRQLDRVTQDWLSRRKVLETAGASDYRLFAHLYVFRMFNLPATYDALLQEGALAPAGTNVGYRWNERLAVRVLLDRAKRKHQVFTGAYIITNNGQKRSKIEMVCEAITAAIGGSRQIYKTVDPIVARQSIEFAVQHLSTLPMVGHFIGYELASDMRWMKMLRKATDTLTWANPGPGARRGVHRILSGSGHLPLTNEQRLEFRRTLDYVQIMRELLAESPLCTGGVVPPLEMRDIEHSLCEFDKYMRVKLGEGRPRSKYRQPTGETK